MEHVKTVRHIGFRLLVLLLSLLPCEVVADTVKQDGVYGKIDNLRLIYEGNRLVSVHDDAAKLLYNGAVDFNGNADGWASLRYTATGALKSDTGRGIALIEYDQWDNPRRVQFTNGNVTEYIYTATGEKLRTIHYTAMPNITVEQDTRHDLTEGEILYKDSTDYHDALIMENGRPSMYQFDGGYCSLWDKTSKAEELSFHYYTKDHLGNNREVVSEDGTVEQVTNYYPFGTPYSDHTAKGVSLQKYKYNGKELDLTHGLNTYDYGARQYYSVLLRWDRLDPLCEKYYHVSPYVYCMNNPVNSIDPDGRTIVIAGNREQRLRVLTELQKLTNDKLGVKYNGVVTIMANGTKNRGMKLTTGTSLISELVGHKRTVEIMPDDHYHERGVYRRDVFNGKGTDTKVWYDFDDPVSSVVRDRKSGKSIEETITPHIALGHELIHAHRSLNGDGKDINQGTRYSYKGIDGLLTAPIEELETTGIKDIRGLVRDCRFTENKLREEENLNERLRY